MTSGTSGNTTQGPAFRIMREGVGCGIRELARMSEVSANTISLWERGKRDVSVATQKHLEESFAAWREGRRS